MLQKKTKPRAVAGVVAPAPKPTLLGAAVFAAMVTAPIAITILTMDLLLL